MNTKIMHINNLIAHTDKLEYRSGKCCYSTCTHNSITSHTIAKNSLYKLNKDLQKVLTFQSKLLPVMNSQLMRKVNIEKFSTFDGFCETHDCQLFKSIDLFDGIMNKEKAALIHYRNICYGINHIQNQLQKVVHISQQNYTQEKLPDVDDENNIKMLMDGALANRLNYCLNEHLLRKKQLEDMLQSGKFDQIDFIELHGDLDNPIFCGRSAQPLHKNNSFFENPGYCYMPWITYMTLLTMTNNHLVFCWLADDEEHAIYLKDLLRTNDFKKIIELLAYACSDSLAVDESFHCKHSLVIEGIMKNLRVY